MDRCRYGSSCWRPVCPYVHAGRRARGWAELWTLLASQEDADDGGNAADAVHRQCCDAGDQPDDQARRDSADTVHRQSYCSAYYDIATDPSGSDCADDGGNPAEAVHFAEQIVDVPAPQILEEIVEANSVTFRPETNSNDFGGFWN